MQEYSEGVGKKMIFCADYRRPFRFPGSDQLPQSFLELFPRRNSFKYFFAVQDPCRGGSLYSVPEVIEQGENIFRVDH